MNGERSGSGPDEEVLLALYAEHGEPLLDDALDLTSGDRRRAQALVREALLRAWRRPDAFDPGRGSTREWLRSVLRGLAAEAGSAAGPVGPAPPAAEEATEEVAEEDAVERGRHRSARTLRVAEAVRALVPAHRTALVEAFYRGRSMEETAEALGVPVGTVKSRLYHALTQLRAELSERGRGTGPGAGDAVAAGRAGAAPGSVAPADSDRADERRTRTSGFDPARLSLGAYVLGGLAPDEAQVMAAHLATCADCRAERDALATLVPLLETLGEADVIPGRAVPAAAGPEGTVPVETVPAATVPAETAPPETPPAETAPAETVRVGSGGAGEPGPGEAAPARTGVTTRDETHHRSGDQRRREWARRAAVLAVVVVVAALTWVVASRVSSPGTTSRIGGPGTRTFKASDQASGMSATVTTAPTPWGSEVRLDVSGIPSGTHCTLVAVGLEGGHETAATWLAGNGDDTVPIPGAISKSMDAVARFEVDTDSGPLLSITTS
ncbi:sigma-70 family RNA polymerase sigma factor [Streptomyces sp. NPDC001135]